MTVELFVSSFSSIIEELSVSGKPDDPEKADMRIVQASAQEVPTLNYNYMSRLLYTVVYMYIIRTFLVPRC